MSLSDSGPCTEFEGELLGQSEKAFHIRFKDSGKDTWVPKSQAEWVGKDTWLLTDWIAEQKELL